MLAALLLRRGRAVTLAELIDAVWGVEPPSAAVSVLRTYVSRLRKALEPDRGPDAPPRTIVSVGDGYRARTAKDALDLAAFERQVADAAKATAAGDISTAAALLHRALDGWRGVALAGLPGPLAEAERSRLAEERLNALERRLDLDVRLGRHGQVVSELMALTGEHPLREELCRLHMLALYRSGRQAEALAAYRGTRATLVTELGIEPGAPLRDLHARILASDPSLLPTQPPASALAPVSTLAAPFPAPTADAAPHHPADPAAARPPAQGVPHGRAASSGTADAPGAARSAIREGTPGGTAPGGTEPNRVRPPYPAARTPAARSTGDRAADPTGPSTAHPTGDPAAEPIAHQPTDPTGPPTAHPTGHQPAEPAGHHAADP
ncbi:BTAD domain-containing putative transcriptional regulator, partial [Streptomyces mangrovisoli]|uniref:BTAD domain-containing putative transcriptional regulator n=1 Tax=Streptomyces mangrovisoli TaxID=1428628 RepID=UPI0030B8041E